MPLERDALLGRQSLKRLVSDVPEQTLRDWEAAGLFPKRVRVRGRVFWSEREVLEWIEQQKSAREGAA